MANGYKLFEIVSDEPFLNEDKINKALNKLLTTNKDNGISPLKEYAYIKHDKDFYTSERIEQLQRLYPDNEDYKKLKVGDKRKPHWHVYLRMNYSVSFKFVAKNFDIEENNVNKVISRFANCLNYATHNTEEAKKQGKYLYDDEEVKSNFKWKEERQKAIDNEEKKNRKEEIINQILDGTIRQFNYTDYITGQEYIKFKKEIDCAFKYRIDKIKGDERNMEAIFITGKSGCGKTTYAKLYAEKLGYSYYISSGSNDVLDGYGGQDCLILDDLRPSCMGLSDLLKMLDNHTSSTVKSRYYNKVLECKLIIITSVLTLEEFFKNVFTEQKEPIKQLQRRCKTKIRMEDDYMYLSFYDDEKEKYTSEVMTINDILKKYPRTTYKTEEQINDRAKTFMLNENNIIIHPSEKEEIKELPFK